MTTYAATPEFDDWSDELRDYERMNRPAAPRLEPLPFDAPAPPKRQHAPARPAAKIRALILAAVQAEPGIPTTCLRRLAAGGTTTFWSQLAGLQQASQIVRRRLPGESTVRCYPIQE